MTATCISMLVSLLSYLRIQLSPPSYLVFLLGSSSVGAIGVFWHDPYMNFYNLCHLLNRGVVIDMKQISLVVIYTVYSLWHGHSGKLSVIVCKWLMT